MRGNASRALWLALFCLLLAVENLGPIYPFTRIWFKPLITSIFFVFLVAQDFSLIRDSFAGGAEKA